ncbi:MAG: hypothetical protein WC538_21005 [Thermoanaerobaculia bacterium]|jgi:hypothetical protein
MQNISTILAVFEEDGTAVVIAGNASEARVLVRVRQLGESGAVIFARIVEALFARPEAGRTLVLFGADASSTVRKFVLPAGTAVVRLPAWSVVARVLRNADQEHDGERRPIPPRL